VRVCINKSGLLVSALAERAGVAAQNSRSKTRGKYLMLIFKFAAYASGMGFVFRT
jgi:hypothetical protein